MGRGSRGQNQGALCAVFVMMLGGISASATQAAPQPQSLTDSDTLDSICGDILARAEVDAQNKAAGKVTPAINQVASTAQTKLTHCQAAKQAAHAASADDALWKVWIGVATVCTAACGASLAGVFFQPLVCSGASVGAGIADAIATENLASVFAPVATAVGGYFANDLLNKDTVEKTAKEAGTESTKTKKDVSACMSAAAAGIQIYVKFKASQDQGKAYRENLFSAKNDAGTDGSALSGLMAANTPGASGGSTSADSHGAQTGVTGNTPADSTPISCRETSTSGSVFACALASDSNIPHFVATPKFQSEFKKISGKSFDDLIAQHDNPTSALGSALGSRLNAEQSGKLLAALNQARDLAGDMDPNTPEGMYRGGHGVARSGDGDGEMGSIAGLLSSLMGSPGTKEGAGLSKGLKLVATANQNRSPAAVAEDSKLNLFDRVSYRYLIVSGKGAL